MKERPNILIIFSIVFVCAAIFMLPEISSRTYYLDLSTTSMGSSNTTIPRDNITSTNNIGYIRIYNTTEPDLLGWGNPDANGSAVKMFLGTHQPDTYLMNISTCHLYYGDGIEYCDNPYSAIYLKLTDGGDGGFGYLDLVLPNKIQYIDQYGGLQWGTTTLDKYEYRDYNYGSSYNWRNGAGFHIFATDAYDNTMFSINDYYGSQPFSVRGRTLSGRGYSSITMNTYTIIPNDEQTDIGDGSNQLRRIMLAGGIVPGSSLAYGYSPESGGGIVNTSKANRVIYQGVDNYFCTNKGNETQGCGIWIYGADIDALATGTGQIPYMVFNSTPRPYTNVTFDLGNLSNYWNNTYTQYVKLQRNATVNLCNATNEGMIYYDGVNKKHYGCNSTAWNAFY